MAKFEDKRPVRSNGYQWLINEVPVSHEILAVFPNSKSYQGILNPFNYNERYYELKDQLKAKTWQIAKQVCTERQFVILELCLDGYTQGEIAKKLNCNQSSVTKSLNGNMDYMERKGEKKRKVYGGTMKKLKKVLFANPEIMTIIEEMNELAQEID